MFSARTFRPSSSSSFLSLLVNYYPLRRHARWEIITVIVLARHGRNCIRITPLLSYNAASLLRRRFPPKLLTGLLSVSRTVEAPGEMVRAKTTPSDPKRSFFFFCFVPRTTVTVERARAKRYKYRSSFG